MQVKTTCRHYKIGPYHAPGDMYVTIKFQDIQRVSTEDSEKEERGSGNY